MAPLQSEHSDNYPLYCDPNLKQTQELLRKIPHPFKIEFSNNLEVIAALVASGAGFGILPERVAKAIYKPLRKHDDAYATVIDELCLVYRADAQNNAVSQKLRHEIKKMLSEN